MMNKELNKSKILLVQLFGSIDRENEAYVGAQLEEPLSLEYLASSLENNGYMTEVLKSSLTLDEFIFSLEKNRPVAVGFCVYTPTYEKSLCFAKMAKEKAEELGFQSYIIFGGYHCSALPEESVQNECVDYVVSGEGENTICELIEALTYGKEVSAVKGLYYLKDGKIIKTAQRERVKNIDSIPWPKRYEEFTCQNKHDVTNLAFPPASYEGNFGRLIYSRGCPFACSFCSSRNTWGSEIYWRSPKDVVDEIEMLVEKFSINYVGFMDLTFNASKQKTMDLCKELVKRNLPVHLGAMVRVDLFDREMLEALAEARFVKFAIGLESPLGLISRKVKDAYSSKENHIKDILSIANNLGFIIRAFVIIGFPEETKEILGAYPDELNKYDVDEIRITIATPFPSTQLWNECHRRKLMPEKINWNDYTTEKLVFNHPYLSNQELLLIREKISTSFYFDKKYIERVSRKIAAHPYLKNSWTEFFKSVREKKLLEKHRESLEGLIDSLDNINC